MGIERVLRFRRYRLPALTLAGSVPGFIFWAAELELGALRSFDDAVYRWLSGSMSAGMTAVMQFISSLASVYTLCGIGVGSFLLLGVWKRRWFYGISVPVELLAAAVLNLLLKSAFHRPRPQILQLVHESGYGFPSGHAMLAVACYGFLIVLCLRFAKKAGRRVPVCLLAVLVLLIGVSRVYLGVHYASDVVGGYLAGLSWLMLFILLSEAWVLHRRHRREALAAHCLRAEAKTAGK